MTERRFFILEETVPATEIESFMCRVVTSKTLPLTKFAPVASISPGTPSHNTNDIIPSILPKPSFSTSRKEFLRVVREREICIGLTTFFGLNFAHSKEESKMLESQLVKRYMLPNPEHHFQQLMQNEPYARDVRALLEGNSPHHAYLVTGFLTTTGAVWKMEAGWNTTNGFEVTAPVSELVGVPVSGLLDFSVGPNATTSSRQKREMAVAEEEIFAVSYSIAKLSYSFSRSARLITKTPIIGPPKRAKAYHLALGHDDSDEEIEVDSDNEYGDDGDTSTNQKGVPVQVETDIVVMEDDERSPNAAGKGFHIDCI